MYMHVLPLDAQFTLLSETSNDIYQRYVHLITSVFFISLR